MNKRIFRVEKLFFNQIFNRVILRMWTVWCARLENTQKVEIAEETEFLRISKKSFFYLKIAYRFWKLTGSSIWYQTCAFFGREAQGYTLQRKFGPFCNRKFPSISHTSDLSAKKVWKLNNTGYPREKNIPENVSKLTNLWFKRTKHFIAIRSEMQSTEWNKH